MDLRPPASRIWDTVRPMRLALLLGLTAFAAMAADETAAVKEVNAAMDGLRAAMLKGDRPALEHLLHADLTYEHSSAKTENKAETIAAMTKAGALSTAVEFHDGAVHVYGDAGLYKGKVDITGATGSVSHLDVLMVWIKTKTGWQLLARHSTKLP